MQHLTAILQSGDPIKKSYSGAGAGACTTRPQSTNKTAGSISLPTGDSDGTHFFLLWRWRLQLAEPAPRPSNTAQYILSANMLLQHDPFCLKAWVAEVGH
eukprot:CAMPEP_0202366984 /NCGR_PEP_ID=MMETSP1126-20121109/17383_1 /ASSEMBLY_ACC=CAM_ASM_000457 /TAXON_ID=3047 /ORGANISM="Dunaliella tertiolecta, Strain CCMP1320" /LENGTH=99 /DNA_ID=CAMNT_0048962155 /DNA_START=1230 /DNA_END=1529 /DNA_ORIENTATION=-